MCISFINMRIKAAKLDENFIAVFEKNKLMALNNYSVGVI